MMPCGDGCHSAMVVMDSHQGQPREGLNLVAMLFPGGVDLGGLSHSLQGREKPCG
jgi:hypothetical protein